MSADVPTLLAVLGTALMAIVIFAPARLPPRPAISFAPPLLRRAHTPDPWPTEPADDDGTGGAEWPGLVDARARGCDAAARLALVDALASVRGAWAIGVLRLAHDDETDPLVRARIRDALGGTDRR